MFLFTITNRAIKIKMIKQTKSSSKEFREANLQWKKKAEFNTLNALRKRRLKYTSYRC